MEKLSSGEFFGVTSQKLETGGLILTNTAYTHDYVDWHHHENVYFTFLLTGKVIEGNKKGKVNLSAGGLLFHNVQESHYNIKPPGETRGMHLELRQSWIREMYPNVEMREGSFEISCPRTKILFYKLLRESQMADDLSALGIQNLVMEAINPLFSVARESKFRPSWVDKAGALLRDNYLCPPDLKTIAAVAGVHPVHLSRSFTKYFGCTIAEYMRLLKVERAFTQLSLKGSSLSTIAHSCGFADQSHMIRCFKAFSGDTPLFFRRLIKF
ncbi:AraC family transcriptional regulator [Pedobacter sp. KBW06]|uniref:AraC family transcriptional regulator n=1 Tax=Pedobacter sp. KBW06 TaxID=2153359 RepID=UPI000F5AB8AA|nr:AraC family transcriptional regulator [Pedobacter sp. KBW06]RQO66410.1 AraC family transcriptional regulator [Pedobacter sp. KBW06]